MPQSHVHKVSHALAENSAADLILYVKQYSIQFYWSIPVANTV